MKRHASGAIFFTPYLSLLISRDLVVDDYQDTVPASSRFSTGAKISAVSLRNTASTLLALRTFSTPSQTYEEAGTAPELLHMIPIRRCI